jgi:LPXTG-motif cell wall-anchored protein
VDLGVDDATPAGAADAALTVDLGMDDEAPADATDAALAVDLGVGDTTPAAAEADVTLGLSGLGDLAPAVDAPTLPALPGAISSDGLLGDIPGIGVDVDDLVPPTVCLGCGQDTSTGGTTAPTPGAPGTGQTGTSGVVPGPTGTTTTRLAPLRPVPQAGPGGTLPLTGDALDLLALVAMALLAAGGLFLRAVRPLPLGRKEVTASPAGSRRGGGRQHALMVTGR